MLKKILLVVLFINLAQCSTFHEENVKTSDSTYDFRHGYLAFVQGPTSDKETLINVLVPRLKNYTYELSEGAVKRAVKPLNTVTEKTSYYKVDQFHFRELKLNTTYTLTVYDTRKDVTYIVDQRTFQPLDIHKKTPRFALASCMSDEWKFDTVINPIWKKLEDQSVDFVIFSGDTVYVDLFGFVERQKATATDLWFRYTQTLQRLPFYHQKKLTPVFATWDDHDYGTNDGDRTSTSKEPATRLFQAVFQGEKLDDGSWQSAGLGVASVFKAFGQQFLLMDDRSFRQPNKEQKKQETYGHWGEQQHQWLKKHLQSPTPTWIVNGNQIVSGKALGFKESLQENHALQFSELQKDIRTAKAPVVLASGDVHFSEVMKIPADRFGFETYEITSSSVHSYNGRGWDNPLRVPGLVTLEYNFLVIQSTAEADSLNLNIQSIGLPEKPYFESSLKIQRGLK